jgi:hypothetical protein
MREERRARPSRGLATLVIIRPGARPWRSAEQKERDELLLQLLIHQNRRRPGQRSSSSRHTPRTRLLHDSAFRSDLFHYTTKCSIHAVLCCLFFSGVDRS